MGNFKKEGLELFGKLNPQADFEGPRQASDPKGAPKKESREREFGRLRRKSGKKLATGV